MMNRTANLIIRTMLFFLLSASVVMGEIDWELWNSIKVPGTPVDVAISSRADRLFVLTKEGALQVYLGKDQWKEIKLDHKPLAISTSSLGKRVLVLTEGGHIQMFNADGEFVDRMKVDPAIRGIKLDPSGNVLFLIDSKQKTVQVAFVDFVRDINTVGSPYKGAPDAPVVITEFSDFECFYCKRLTPILDQILELYQDKVKIVFKNFPLNSHKQAAMAAQAALAAGRQNRFWEYHNRLFDNADQLNDAKIYEIAEEIDLDLKRFRADMTKPEITAMINQDIRDGRRAGIRGVPTVFVNGRRLKKHSIETFAEIIEEELRKSANTKK